MARNRWRGDALAVAQVNTFAFAGTWEANDIIQVVIGNKTVNFTAGSTSAATVVSNLVTAWAALDSSVYPEFAEITPSASTTNFVLTAATAGVPFTATLHALESDGSTDGDSQTIATVNTATSGTATTASSGPNHWDTAANWSLGAVPVNTNDVDLENSDVDILYGLAQSSVTLASLNADRSYTGKVGLPTWNENGYYEYRATELAIGATLVNIGRGNEGAGTGRFKLNTGSVQTAINGYFTGSEIETGIPAFLWRGTHASNAANFNRGFYGCGFFAGEAFTLATLNVGYIDNPAGDVRLILGGTGTLSATAFTMTGGEASLFSATTSTAAIIVYDGTLNLEGTGGHVSLTVRGGRVNYKTSGTLGGNPVVSGSGWLDFSQDLRTVAVTNAIERYGDQARITDPAKRISSLVIDNNECSSLEALVIGTNFKITRAAVT